jgi:hypothetical protein
LNLINDSTFPLASVYCSGIRQGDGFNDAMVQKIELKLSCEEKKVLPKLKFDRYNGRVFLMNDFLPITAVDHTNKMPSNIN